jgi:hypothetical protein
MPGSGPGPPVVVVVAAVVGVAVVVVAIVVDVVVRAGFVAPPPPTVDVVDVDVRVASLLLHAAKTIMSTVHAARRRVRRSTR